MNTMISTYEAKAHLSRLLAEVERTGQPITICRNHKPVVDLVPHRHSDPLLQNPDLKGARFRADPFLLVDEEDWPGAMR